MPFVPTCLGALRALNYYVSACLRTYVSPFSMYLRSYVPACLKLFCVYVQVVVEMRLLGQFYIYIYIFFYDKISEVQKSTINILVYSRIRFHKYKKVQKSTINILFFFQDKISQVQKSTINILALFRIRFYIKCRLKVNLTLFICMYFYLKAIVKKNLP